MQDLAAGSYRLPWEEQVRHTDGTGAGLGTPADVRAAARRVAGDG
jgi:formamidase